MGPTIQPNAEKHLPSLTSEFLHWQLPHLQQEAAHINNNNDRLTAFDPGQPG